MHISKRKRIL